MTVFLHIIVRKFNVSLTNDAISFEQLGPEVTLIREEKCLSEHYTIYKDGYLGTQAFDVSGISEYTVSSNMVSNCTIYIEVPSPYVCF